MSHVKYFEFYACLEIPPNTPNYGEKSQNRVKGASEGKLDPVGLSWRKQASLSSTFHVTSYSLFNVDSTKLSKALE